MMGCRAGQAPEVSASGACPPEIERLADLCPKASRDFLAYVFRKEGLDLEAAVFWLLDCEDVERAQREWGRMQEVARERRAAEARAEKASRKQTVDKYLLQAEPQQARTREGRAVDAWHPAEPAAKPKVRYRDGRPVSTKGEKFVVEEVGEEWNGGSKGKVQTKGKRGKGFV